MKHCSAWLLLLATSCRLYAATLPSMSCPKGIFAVIGWNDSPKQSTWTNNLVDGIVIRTYWKDINPRKGIYDWSYLDAQFKNALQFKKGIHLIVAPGFYSPDWVLESPDVQTARFDVPGGPHHTLARGQLLPLPWDETYLSLWFDFVQKLVERYARLPQLAYVSITGPNSHNGEIALPRSPSDQKAWLRLAGSDPAALKEKLEAAWMKTVDRFCRAFPEKQATLALIQKSLPLDGQAQLEMQYRNELAQYGASRYPCVFGIQTNGLDESSEASRQWEMIREYSGKIFVGLQTREPENLYGGRNATPEHRRQVLEKTFANGLSCKPDFIEIYEADAGDPSLTGALAAARDTLLKD